MGQGLVRGVNFPQPSEEVNGITGWEKAACCSSQLWESPLGESRVSEMVLCGRSFPSVTPGVCEGAGSSLGVRAQPTKPLCAQPWRWLGLSSLLGSSEGFSPHHVHKCKESSAKCFNKASLLSWSARQGLATIKHFSA